MAFLLYIVGLIAFVAGLGWLFTALGVGPTVVNTGALALLVAGVAFGIARLRLPDR